MRDGRAGVGADERGPGVLTIARRLGIIAFVALVLGCGGGGAEMKSDISTTTAGQQLLDLKKAYEAGAISKDEYEEMRERIVKGK
jgi:uncharacterized membrane protein